MSFCNIKRCNFKKVVKLKDIVIQDFNVYILIIILFVAIVTKKTTHF